MKATDTFKRTIQEFLDKLAGEDSLFAERYFKPGKSVDECVNFILNTVKNSGRNGFTDDEVFGIAIHYFDEDELDDKYLKQIGCDVVVNHHVSLSDDEKSEIAEKARKDYYEECLRKQRELVSRPKRKDTKDDRQLTLF